jgi:hypothetical protein
MRRQPEDDVGLHRLSAEELALVLAYRNCCSEHRSGIRWFASASFSRCDEVHTPGPNVIPISACK